ncbi:RNase H domain-containing protein [Trichonephila clavipes]|uniref:RNase H domain-containing protein n=1 Tax=Trichonephila clavipes TaxID=2585209 RepID=A0A8X6VLX3_TRICX|nr:RNase H domain-containing protein [Trichonephila clavipes]
MSMKAEEQKCLQKVSTEDEEKGEAPVDVIQDRAKDNLNPKTFLNEYIAPTKLDIKQKRVQETNKNTDELKDQYYDNKDISDSEIAEIEDDLEEMEKRLEDLEIKIRDILNSLIARSSGSSVHNCETEISQAKSKLKSEIKFPEISLLVFRVQYRINALRFFRPTTCVLISCVLENGKVLKNPFSYITPIDSFNHVEFREELLTSTPKHSSHPELLRQLALEVINDIPDQALIIYTDGSRSDTGKAGSGIFSNIPGTNVKISIRTPDHCSAFRSELIAISGALDHALNSYKDSIWILTDSRSSIQYLHNWPKIMDNTGLDIVSKLARLSQRKQVCLQWIPSHVAVTGNKAADELVGRGCGLSNLSSTILSRLEIHSLQRTKLNLTWQSPPAHHWYAAKSLGLSLQ